MPLLHPKIWHHPSAMLQAESTNDYTGHDRPHPKVLMAALAVTTFFSIRNRAMSCDSELAPGPGFGAETQMETSEKEA